MTFLVALGTSLGATVAHDQQILQPSAIWEIVRATCQPRTALARLPHREQDDGQKWPNLVRNVPQV